VSMPGHDDYRRPPFNPDRIRRGVDLCNAALAKAKAIREGVDPDDAADIAEGEAAVRRTVLAERCPHCNAPEGEPCVPRGTRGGELRGGYHDSRTQRAQEAAA
jgi:hypothetical protein